MRVSVIIPTRDRPQELKNCLKSIFRQTKEPDEIVIVYAGNPPDTKNLTELAGKIKLRFLKNEKKVMTHGKNIGLKKAAGDIIFIFDDDVILQKNYLLETIKVFQNDLKGRVGIVAGTIINVSEPPLKFFRKIFLLAGRGCYRVLPSGANVINNQKIKNPTEVDWASGCAMAIRKKVAREFRVDEKYDLFGFRYGSGEDLDFSYRVGKKYKIIFSPSSRLRHVMSRRGRVNFLGYGFIYIVNREYFLNKNMNSYFHYILFYWSILGWLLENILGVIKSPRKHLPMLVGGVFALVYLFGKSFWRLFMG